MLGVPISLVVVYAVYRANEYYMLRRLRAIAAAPPGVFPRKGQLILSSFLFPARVFGWVFLLYYAFRDGWLAALILLAIAFPLSLIIQLIPRLAFRTVEPDAVDGLLTFIGFFVLPICALLMFLFLP